MTLCVSRSDRSEKMCTIMVYTGQDMPDEEFERAFAKTASRGPDMQRVVRFGGGIVGFQRLAIMGLTEEGMQPFFMDGNCAVCNGELYGFRKIKRELEGKGYTFSSDSDCELILPLYREYGTEMFGRLDAEFAMVIYDAERGGFVAARDPIGIRPLFYGYSESGRIVFASEAKNLTDIADEVRAFPPGCYYADGEFVRYADPAFPGEKVRADIETATRNIREKLVAGIAKRLDADAPVGFLLSGGLDSSIVCAVAARILQKPVRTFAIGMDTDAIDLKYAAQVADHIGADHTEVIIDRNDVLSSLEDVVAALGTFDITTVRASVGMYLVCKYIREHTDIKVLLTGEVSDELFGYKYTDFAPTPAAFGQEAEKRVRELYMYDVLRADRCISVHGMEARVPFGDLDFVKYVMRLDPAIKMNVYGKGKYLLRKAFEGDLLPENILWREKAAFSDAVGHSMVGIIRDYAESRFTDEEYERRRARYSHARPFTKESLLYREIFEKYYPRTAASIVDFWMPNREWEGLRGVKDPSARVLSNYGASGV